MVLSASNEGIATAIDRFEDEPFVTSWEMRELDWAELEADPHLGRLRNILGNAKCKLRSFAALKRSRDGT